MMIVTGDNGKVAAMDIQLFAASVGWGGVSPLTQQRVRFRDTMREAVIQKRGPMFFGVAFDNDGRPHCAGPMGSSRDVARTVIDRSLGK